MTLPIASAARVGNVEFVSFYDDDLARPTMPVAPEPIEGEAVEDFEARAAAFKAECEIFEKAIATFNRRLTAARETQTWTDVLKPSGVPDVFVCRPIPPRMWRAIQAERPNFKTAYAYADVLLRAALVEVRGARFAGFRLPPIAAHTITEDDGRTRRTAIGQILPDDLADHMARAGDWSGNLADTVVEDIGTQILNHRMRAPVP